MKTIFTRFDTEAVMYISLTTDAMQTCYNLLTVNGLRNNAELTPISVISQCKATYENSSNGTQRTCLSSQIRHPPPSRLMTVT